MDISQDLEEALGGILPPSHHTTPQDTPTDMPRPSHEPSSLINSTTKEDEEEWENWDSSNLTAFEEGDGEKAGSQNNAHHQEEQSEKPMVGVNVGVTIAVLGVVALIVLVTVGVLKEHRFIRFQGWRLLQAGERDTTVGIKATDGITTMRDADKKKRKKKKKKRRMSPRRKLQSLLGPSHLGFSRLRTYDSNSEDEEFPVFNRV